MKYIQDIGGRFNAFQTAQNAPQLTLNVFFKSFLFKQKWK